MAIITHTITKEMLSLLHHVVNTLVSSHIQMKDSGLVAYVIHIVRQTKACI